MNTMLKGSFWAFLSPSLSEPAEAEVCSNWARPLAIQSWMKGLSSMIGIFHIDP
jgi:hypothetical protein